MLTGTQCLRQVKLGPIIQEIGLGLLCIIKAQISIISYNLHLQIYKNFYRLCIKIYFIKDPPIENT